MENKPPITSYDKEEKLAKLGGTEEAAEVKREAAAEEKEERKSWARSLLYPLNHALSCLFTDFFIQPFTGAYIQKRIQDNKLPKWLGDIVGAPPEGAPKNSSFRENIKYWFSGEVIGDLSAVPLTAFIHRFIPGFSSSVRKIAEPSTKKFFEKGATRSAEKWAREHGLDPHGPQAQARKEELYEYEVNHLGDVAAWNAFSAVIGVEAQKKLGNPANRKTLYTGKIFGSIVSNYMLLTARAAIPGTFQKAEDKISDISHKLLGFRHHKKPAQDIAGKNWAEDVSEKPDKPQEATR